MLKTNDLGDAPDASQRLRERMRSAFTFQISVDTDDLEQGLAVAHAALAGGVTLLEMGTPLLKLEGVHQVVPAFRRAFPEALLLADMKTMDGGGGEARAVFAGGANIIDFLALAGESTARAACAVRDEFRRLDLAMPRLAFADILLPHQAPAGHAIEAARRMLDMGVDGVGVHLQFDARSSDPQFDGAGLLSEVAQAVFEAVGERASVQVVGGLSTAQARALAQAGLRAFVISGNLGLPDGTARYGLPAAEITGHVAEFISTVSQS